MNNKINQNNYQISGIEPNYTINGIQNLPFDQSSISSSGYLNNQNLAKGIEQQQEFTNNNNKFIPLSTFENSKMSVSSNLENLNTLSQYNIEKNFEIQRPIMFMPNTQNKHNTLYDNLNEDLLKESLKEYRLNIDSINRDVRIYPDPFNYIVSLGPITNSGINASVSKPSLKTELKNELKNQRKKNLNIQKNYLEQEEKRQQNASKTELTDAVQSEIFIFNNPEAIKEYTINLERSFNPYIIRDFKNINYIKLDCVVIPKYTSICINEHWDFCRKNHHKKNFFKDEYDRIKDYIILNNRYIPNDKDEYNPLGDRFVQIFIKELQSTRNFGTNPITDKSFILIYDKTLGALYLKLIPYSATKIYKESLLGNLTKLSIQFFDSWGEPLKLDTHCIDYEINQISNTNLIAPCDYNINNFIDKIYNKNNLKSCTTYFNSIIKCFIMINSNIQQIIPFYTPDTKTEINLKYSSENSRKGSDKLKFHEDCLEFETIILNKQIFELCDIYSEFDKFVSLSGFVQKIIKSKTSKKIKLNIDEFINHVLWYDFDEKQIDKIIHNIMACDKNYRDFGFEILDKLKTEIINIPINKNFQNFLTFLLGIWEDELNTKIDYRN